MNEPPRRPRSRPVPPGAPPSDADWSQPATKGDIARLENRIGMTETRLDARIDVLDAKLGGRMDAMEGRFDRKISRLTWTMIVGYVATVLALVGLKAVTF